MGIEIDEDLVRKVENLKYVDHDVRDLTNLPEFGLDKYMKHIPNPSGVALFQVQDHALSLKISRILRILDIPISNGTTRLMHELNNI